MVDPQVRKLADLLVNYSIQLKRHQTLLISADMAAAPLIREVYLAAIRRGAHVETAIDMEGLAEIFANEASMAQLKHISPLALVRTKKIDAMVGIWADTNTRSMSNVDPERLACIASVRKQLSRIFLRRIAKGELRCVVTQWPTNACAQEAKMSLSEYEEFLFRAGYLDDDNPIATWKAISKSQGALKHRLDHCKEIHIVAEDTDIMLSVEGRTWINCDGHENYPDGEVFTGPVEKAVNGYIRFNFPIVHGGREIENVFLEFKKGKAVRAEADKGQDFLRAMIEMDAGSHYLGELAFGTNYNIRKYTRNTLFDEKIGGTVHLALGMGHPKTGSKNESSLHWDMVCDLRKGGKVYADGKLIQRDGRFLGDQFP